MPRSAVLAVSSLLTALLAGACGDGALPTELDRPAGSHLPLACDHDDVPPVIQSVGATPNVLWPPNHKMVPVTVSVGVTDDCSTTLASRITHVTSNEPVNGIGDGNTAPDWEITGALTVNLRAERAGPGSGRVYTVHVSSSDAAGNIATAATTVTVPHDQGKGPK